MCGLFGFSGKQPADITKLRWLAVENESRGSHSTGIYVTKGDKRKTKILLKDTKAADLFINDPEVHQAMNGSYVIQGHTRHATVGSITIANAHPFEFDFSKENGTKVIGAHNGFVLDEYPKGTPQHEQFGFTTKFEVDSMLIFAALAKTGDYNILPKLEGGIACSFQMPNKYGDALFLYQSSGRSLYVGQAPEGLYYSSEDKPLKYIGCRGILQIPYNSLVVITGGVIEDIAPMSKPQINVSLNAKRDTFQLALTEGERKKLGFEPTEYSLCNYKPAPKYAASTVGNTSTKTTTIKDDLIDVQDQLNLVIEDVKDAVEGLVDEPLSFVRQLNHDIAELTSCMVLINLISTPKNLPLPGWTIYSESNSKIAGITALNGTTILQVPLADCGKPHKLLMTCPIELVDHPSVYSIEVNPIQGRVVEVALTLPFPQKNTFKASSSETTIVERSKQKLLGLGTKGLNHYIERLKQIRGIGFSQDNNSIVLSSEQIKVHPRSSKKEVYGESECAISTKDDQSTTDTIDTGSNLVARSSSLLTMLPTLNLADANAILEHEYKTFRLKTKVAKVLKSSEYSHGYAKWLEVCQNSINLRKLFHDASVLKLNDLDRWNSCWSLEYYAWFLVVYNSAEYENSKLTDTVRKKLWANLGKLRGNITNAPTVSTLKKKSDDSVYPNFGLSLSFYKDITEYITSKLSNIKFTSMFYTEEKQKALLKVLHSQQSALQTNLKGMQDVKDFLEKHVTLEDMMLRVNINRMIQTLIKENELISSFKDELQDSTTSTI